MTIAQPGRRPSQRNAACTQLRATLGRWIGSEGYAALLDRALAQVREKHPVLDSLSCVVGERLGIAATKASDGAVSEGITALVEALIELLGRIIGEDLTIRLVAQIDNPSPRGIVSIKSGGRDD